MFKTYSTFIIYFTVLILLNCSSNDNHGSNSDDDDAVYDNNAEYMSKNYCGESDLVYSCQEIGVLENDGGYEDVR